MGKLLKFLVFWLMLALNPACGSYEEILSPTGEFACGTDPQSGRQDFCYPGWSCRLGHCCPPGSDETSCPKIAGSVGSPCQSRTDCTGDTADCLMAVSGATFPGGYCVRLCMNRGDRCGDGLGMCTETPLGLRCLRQCQVAEDGGRSPCRGQGYACFGNGVRYGLCLPERT